MSPSASLQRPGGGRIDARLRAALAACLLAGLVHAIPLFFPRKVPSVELELARLIPQAEHRLSLLTPLLQNPQSQPEHLRDAAWLALPASAAKAREFLEEAERRGPASVDNELLRARICDAERDPSCIDDALARARELGSGDPRPDLLEAELAERAGNQAAALEALRGAHQKTPLDVELTLRLARALGTSRDVREALALIEALGDGLTPARRAVERGVVLLNAGEEAAAREELDRAVGLDRSLASAHYFRAVALARQSQIAQAEVALREADRLDPSDFRPLALLCSLHREEGRLDDAAISRSILDGRFRDQRREYDAICPP